MEDEGESNNKLKTVLIFSLVLLLSGSAIWLLSGLFNQEIEQPKKTIQEIKVIRPPPPPPEVEEEPPPPEPEIEEEIDIPEPEDIPELPDMEPPPGDQLGLDADGGAGSDAFGLLGRKGGRSLIGGASGDRFKWYSNIVVGELLDKLNEDERLRLKKYRVNFKIWLDETGEVTRFELLNSTGDLELDSYIKNSLSTVSRISEAPPSDIKMPITLGMRSR